MGQNEIFFLILDNFLGILSYPYSGCGFANETFSILVAGWVFFVFPIHRYVLILVFACAGLNTSKCYLVFNITQYCIDMFTWRYQTCHTTATLTCQNWVIIMNADPRTARIFINTCLSDDNPLIKKYFRLEVIGLNLTEITWPENSKFFPSFEAFFAEFNCACLSIFFWTIIGRCSLPLIQFSYWVGVLAHYRCSVCCALHLKFLFRVLLGFADLANLTSVQKSLFQLNLLYEYYCQLENLVEEGILEDSQLSIFVSLRLWNTL